MPTRDVSEETGQIASGLSLKSAPVRAGLNEIVSWFTTTAGLGISNGDVATDAAIASTKLIHGSVALNTFLGASGEHNSADGTHTQVSQGVQNLVISSNASNPEYQVDITADFITVENTSGVKHMVGLDVDGNAETISETIGLTTAADSMDATDGSQITEAASTRYTLLCLRDLTTGSVYTTKFVFYAGTSLDSAFYSTDLAGYNTRVSKAYTHAARVGSAYNDANQDLELPSPIGGGSTSNFWIPGPAMVATGTYTGTSASQSVTGVGFTPNIVFGFRHTAQTVYYPVIKTDQMGTTYSKAFDGGWPADAITSLDFDGFTLGTGEGINETGISYSYLAIKTHR